jgi:hypothetical protein
MKALRWSAVLVAFALMSMGLAEFARQRQLVAIEWSVCGKTRAPCVKGVAENGMPWALTYIAVRDELLFIGGMGGSFDDVVGSALLRFPRAERFVVATSPGGLERGVARAARRLNRHAVAVRIDGDCASACALLWALADSRQAMPKGRIGLHAGRPDEKVPAWLRGAAASRSGVRFERALRNAGFPPCTIARGMATPHERIYWIDASSMQRLGVKFDTIGPGVLSGPGSGRPRAPQS